MNRSFEQLSEMRKYWKTQGHKEVPDPLCCCGFQSPTSRSLVRTDGQVYHCSIHAGALYSLYRYIIVFLLMLSKHIAIIDRPVRMLERKYHRENLKNKRTGTGHDNKTHSIDTSR